MKITGINYFKHNFYIAQTQSDITKQMQSLGLTSTGDVESDKAAIEEALEQLSENGQNGNVAGAPPPKTPEEVATFMAKLGLEPTDSKDGDMALITAKLSELEAAATTDEEKEEVSTLREEFAQIKESESSKTQQGPPQDSIAGMQNLATMNKFFLLNS